MDTLALQKWHEDFCQIMESGDPDQLQLDQLRDLHTRSTEQPDMWDDEPIEHETEVML